MQVHIESRDDAAVALRGIAAERLRFTLRRLAWLVSRATVRFTDLNGPRGGVDKRCRVELNTTSRGVVVVTAVAADWRVALEHALARAARALVRERVRARANRSLDLSRALAAGSSS